MLTTVVARQVSVIGSGSEHEAVAEEVGRLLAERGCTVVTGGLGEVMAAAHRGAKSAGGTTIAILPGEAVVAVGGSYGTLAEMAFALRLGRPVVALDGAPGVDGVERASTPAQAVELVLRHLG